jgi:hypothetical protein
MTSRDTIKRIWLNDVREFIERTKQNSDKMGMEKGKEYYINHDCFYNCLVMAIKHFEVAKEKTFAEKKLIEFLYLEFYQVHLRAMIENFNQTEEAFREVSDFDKVEDLKEIKESLLLLGSKIIWLNEYKDEKEIYQATLN